MKNIIVNHQVSAERDWLAGGGEMGKLIREMDWSQTPLGPIERWPQSLRTTVSLCLASNFPISIAWGPAHTQIYNDGYWPICAAKHPRSMGQDFSECWASAWPAIGEAFERALGGQTSYLENQRMFLDRNGYLEETFFTFSFSPIRDESGGVGGLFHPVTETTSKMLAERRTRALRDLAARIGKAQTTEEALVGAAQTLSSYELDLPFVLLYALDETGQSGRLVGSAGLAPGMPASPELIDLATPKENSWPLAEVASAGRVLQVEELEQRFGPLTGGPYPESPKLALAAPITPPGGGRPVALFIAGASSRLPFNDLYRGFIEQLAATVTSAVANALAYEAERRRAEALAEIDRAKTAFFSNVSHEFRTPLTLMLGPLEDLLERPEARIATERETLAVVHRNGLRLLRLVNTLLDFSRIEAGRVQALYEPTDLAALTADLASVFRSAVERAGLTLNIDCPPLVEPVYVDRDMWEKIVLNLLSNAFKFTLEGGITVRLAQVDGMAELAVADTGIGVEVHELPHLFERFHRVEGARGRTLEGSGIGLALVSELVKLHGGSVAAESVHGRGSTFRVRLPLGRDHLPAERLGGARTQSTTALGAAPFVEEALRWLPGSGETQAPEPELPAAAPSWAESPQAGTPGERPRVLLADDNADMRDYVQRLLAPAYDVTAVADGAAALAAALASPPDLVLSDVMMPGLDGFGLIRALRREPRTAAIPIILLSARAGEESRIEGLEAGADDYLVKPFSARELLARLRANLALARLRQETLRLEARLRAEQQVAGQLREQAQLLELANVLAWDLDGKIILWNRGAEALYGWPKEEALGTVVHERLQTAFPEPLERIMAALLRQGQWEGELQHACRDGRRLAVASHWVLHRDERGEPAAVMESNADITDRKRSAEELERRVQERTAQLRETARALEVLNGQLTSSNAALQDFAMVASHDLQEPLRKIQTFGERLSRRHGAELAGEAKDYLERMMSASGRMGGLIDDLLTFARVTSQGRPFEPVDLNQVAAEVLRDLEARAGAAGARVEVEPLPTIEADPMQMRQMLQNLIGNALKFTKPGQAPFVRVYARPEEETAGRIAMTQLCVEDHGIGFDEKYLDRIFKVFQRLEGRSGHEGSGIGLAICRKIAERHGGAITAHSRPGEGATFMVTLPVRQRMETREHVKEN